MEKKLGFVVFLLLSSFTVQLNAKNMLQPGESLAPGQKITSSNNAATLIHQTDGNVVLYDASGKGHWATGTNNKRTKSFVMQTDGNLVIYNEQGQPIWASGTNGNPGAYLKLKDNKSLIIYHNNKALWTGYSSGDLAADATDTTDFLGAEVIEAWKQRAMSKVQSLMASIRAAREADDLETLKQLNAETKEYFNEFALYAFAFLTGRRTLYLYKITKQRDADRDDLGGKYNEGYTEISLPSVEISSPMRQHFQEVEDLVASKDAGSPITPEVIAHAQQQLVGVRKIFTLKAMQDAQARLEKLFAERILILSENYKTAVPEEFEAVRTLAQEIVGKANSVLSIPEAATAQQKKVAKETIEDIQDDHATLKTLYNDLQDAYTAALPSMNYNAIIRLVSTAYGDSRNVWTHPANRIADAKGNQDPNHYELLVGPQADPRATGETSYLLVRKHGDALARGVIRYGDLIEIYSVSTIGGSGWGGAHAARWNGENGKEYRRWFVHNDSRLEKGSYAEILIGRASHQSTFNGAQVFKFINPENASDTSEIKEGLPCSLVFVPSGPEVTMSSYALSGKSLTENNRVWVNSDSRHGEIYFELIVGENQNNFGTQNDRSIMHGTFTLDLVDNHAIDLAQFTTVRDTSFEIFRKQAEAEDALAQAALDAVVKYQHVLPTEFNAVRDQREQVKQMVGMVQQAATLIDAKAQLDAMLAARKATEDTRDALIARLNSLPSLSYNKIIQIVSSSHEPTRTVWTHPANRLADAKASKDPDHFELLVGPQSDGRSIGETSYCLMRKYEKPLEQSVVRYGDLVEIYTVSTKGGLGWGGEYAAQWNGENGKDFRKWFVNNDSRHDTNRPSNDESYGEILVARSSLSVVTNGSQVFKLVNPQNLDDTGEVKQGFACNILYMPQGPEITMNSYTLGGQPLQKNNKVWVYPGSRFGGSYYEVLVGEAAERYGTKDDRSNLYGMFALKQVDNPQVSVAQFTQVIAPGIFSIPKLDGKYADTTKTNLASINTPNEALGSDTISFVTTQRDTHIAFFSNDRQESLFEIVLGGWNNTRSAIRRTTQGAELYGVNDTGIKSLGNENPIEIILNYTMQTITVKGSGITKEFSYTDYDMQRPHYFKITSWDIPITVKNIKTTSTPGSGLGSGLGRIIKIPQGKRGAYDDSTRVDLANSNQPDSALGSDKLTFTLNNVDAYIGLFNKETNECIYSFTLGGWNNTMSVIRRGAQGPHIYEAQGVGITNPGQSEPIEIIIDYPSKKLIVKGSAITKEFSFNDNAMKRVHYAKFSAFEKPITFGNIQVAGTQGPGLISEINFELVAAYYGRRDDITSVAQQRWSVPQYYAQSLPSYTSNDSLYQLDASFIIQGDVRKNFGISTLYSQTRHVWSGKIKDIRSIVRNQWAEGSTIKIPAMIHSISGVGDVVPGHQKFVYIVIKRPNGTIEMREFPEGNAATWNVTN